MKQAWSRIPRFIRNKYSLTIVAFAVWILFFDHHDLISQMRLNSELKALEVDKAYFQQEIGNTRNDLDELLTDDRKLVRFAREKYLMKKDNEEIFVIVEE